MSAVFPMKGFSFSCLVKMHKSCFRIKADVSLCEMLNTTFFKYQNLCFFCQGKKMNVNLIHNLGLKERKRWAVQR